MRTVIKSIKMNQIYKYAENGGRLLVRAGAYELRDGIKNGKRSCFLIDHDRVKAYRISPEACDNIFDHFALTADLHRARETMKQLLLGCGRDSG